MKNRPWRESPWLAGCLAIGISVSVGTLSWLGFRASREWNRSSILLVERRADEAARLLATALARDMRAAQTSVLSSSTWDEFTFDSPHDTMTLVASAFARYPYPESFFAWRAGQRSDSVTFFTRSDRPPPWAAASPEPNLYPVRRFTDSAIGASIVERIQPEVPRHRQLSVFEMAVQGVRYQVIARLRYRDQFKQQLDGVFGFMVNLRWVRQHYFSALTQQVARIGGEESGLAFAIVDERDAVVVSTRTIGNGPIARRSFPVLFFDASLVAVNPPANLYRRDWTILVGGGADPTLAVAMRSSNRTLVITMLAAAFLALGLTLTVRGVRASANLAEIRAEFIASVTHDLKTPIATIRAVGDTFAAGRLATAARQRQFASLIVQEAKRLARLVDNLLALARVTDVTDVYSFESIDLKGIVLSAVKGFNQQLSNANVTVTLRMRDGVPPVRADRMALELVLDNLIDNAIRYSGDSKKLEIAIRSAGTMVALDVIDQGRGIPPDEVDKVTQKFFRGRNAGTGGSGLGLAIVQRIVRDHRGSLTIRSVVDQGTTITVAFPAAADVRPAVHARDSASSGTLVQAGSNQLRTVEKR